MLVIAQTLKEISQAKETLIFLLQNLGFVINLKKSQLTPVKEIEFLGLMVNSVNITLALPQKERFGYPKQIHVKLQRHQRPQLWNNQTPRKTIVHCSGTAFKENSAQVLVTTTNLGSERNKFLSNQDKIKLTVTGRAKVVEGEFTSSEVTSLSGNHDEGTWSYQEKTKHINVLELIE